MKKAKFLSLTLALAMAMGFGTSAFAAEENAHDLHLNSAPIEYSANSNSLEGVASEDSLFSVTFGDVETDIRLNSAPNGYTPSTESFGTEQGVSDVPVSQIYEVAPIDTNLMPTGGGEYSYNPTYWNDSSIVYRANCYGYALNYIATNTSDPLAGYLFQPGYKAGKTYSSYTKEDIIAAVEADMEVFGRSIRSSTYSEKPGANEYKIALVIASNDYHWYRQDSSGYWSHKPGLTNVTNVDASGKLITDPKTCDRNYSYANYSTWGGYYIISK